MGLEKYMQNIHNIKVENTQKTSNSLINGLHLNSSYGRTENEALTYTRTESPLLDFYAQAGAMRERPEQALNLFKKALAEDRTKAIRILFYLRDVRGGQGERQLFRNCLEYLGTDFPEIFEKIVPLIPEYGRWDDLLFDNPKCFEVIDEQLAKDNTSENPSLLAKWLPTINASSPTTRAKANFVANKLNLNEIEYRKLLRKLRKKIDIVEEKMSAREWGKIEYNKVPSQASRIYKNAFKRHDERRYEYYIERVNSGEEKINASTLYPYQIYKTATSDYSPTCEALWKNLPDYTQGKNALVVADVSGSMEGDPMAVSVSLALYFAERNKGQFQNHFITFSGRPTLQAIMGNTLKDKMNSIERAEWDMNTNLQAVFNLIFKTAIQNGVPENEMPETIYIISDMEFDECCDDITNYDGIKQQYAQAGYKIPNIVFWNVNARGNNLPVRQSEKGVSMVSGLSPVIFKLAVENKTPLQVMEDTINSERYKNIL